MTRGTLIRQILQSLASCLPIKEKVSTLFTRCAFHILASQNIKKVWLRFELCMFIEALSAFEYLIPLLVPKLFQVIESFSGNLFGFQQLSVTSLSSQQFLVTYFQLHAIGNVSQHQWFLLIFLLTKHFLVTFRSLSSFWITQCLSSSLVVVVVVKWLL